MSWGKHLHSVALLFLLTHTLLSLLPLFCPRRFVHGRSIRDCACPCRQGTVTVLPPDCRPYELCVVKGSWSRAWRCESSEPQRETVQSVWCPLPAQSAHSQETVIWVWCPGSGHAVTAKGSTLDPVCPTFWFGIVLVLVMSEKNTRLT